jgi:hypothetical protein
LETFLVVRLVVINQRLVAMVEAAVLAERKTETAAGQETKVDCFL